MRQSTLIGVLATLVSVGTSLPLGATDIPLRNWPVPGTTSTRAPRTALADVGAPGVFVAMAPCRVADTRNAIGPYGGPILSTGVIRTFNVSSGPCTGIATNPAAYSLNFTVTGSTTAGAGSFLSVWPTGGPQPLVSTLNFNNGDTLANAAIVPAGTGGGIDVIVSGGTHLIIDINGYFLDAGSTINANEYVGFYGSYSAGLLYASNSSSSTASTVSAVRGTIANASNGAAVLGDQSASTGSNFGVRGNNSSTSSDSAGVLGVGGSRTPGTQFLFRAGVRGESADGNGVYGITSGTGNQVGVGGRVVNAAGVNLASGVLGYPNNGSPLGVQYAGGLGGSGTKSFMEPHPTDASKMIQYYCMEGPESGTYFRGSGRTAGGVATIEVPESFRLVADAAALTVQLTPTGTEFAMMRVETKGLDQIVVRASVETSFDYLVQSVRSAYKDVPSIVPNSMFRPETSTSVIPLYLSQEERQRVIANGTYNPDGTVNMSTAERLGWASAWRELEEPGRPEPAAPVDNTPR